MSALHRKLWRDIRARRGQVLAVWSVMACGVATFVMSLSMLQSLRGTLEAYYDDSRFAHVFAGLERAPLVLTPRIAMIPGVAAVETRVVERVSLDVPGLREPAAGRIIALGDEPRGGLNRLHLRRGRLPEPNTREVLVSEAFAEAHGLGPGQSIDAVLNGRLQALRIAGVALSPEFIYLIPPGALFPDDRRFAVLWMRPEAVAAAFDMDGAFNDVLLRLAAGASEAEVISRLDDLTDRYGGLGAHGRGEQTSHKFVANEIEELRGMTLVVPVIFLGVAAFLLNIVLLRMVAVQREQIAALKALGYSRAEVGRHYLAFGGLVTAAAVVAGTLAGAVMGRGLTSMYAEFFRFPSFTYRLGAEVIALAAVVSAAAALAGVAGAVRGAMRLPPAEAMRPPAPATFRPTVLERWGLHRLLSTAVRMIVRQLERQPGKTMMSCLGIAMATAILVLGSYMEDAVDEVLDVQFNRVQQYDVDVAFVDRTDASSLSSLRHERGVLNCEPYRALPVRLRRGHRQRRVGIMGLARSDGLHRLVDREGRAVTLPDDGILLSSTLADLLGVRPGGSVTVEVLEGHRPTVDVPVTGTVDAFSGLASYMHVSAINRMMMEGRAVSGALLATDPRDLDHLLSKLREAPRVAAVNVKSAVVDAFRDTLGRSILTMRAFILLFAVIIAFGVVYNSSRISLSERSRDLATLRVIGFTRVEIYIIQLGELALLTIVAIPLGLVLGATLARLTSSATESELFRIPFVIERSTFGYASAVVMAATCVSGLIVRRRLDELDLIGVLKARE